MSTAVPSDNDEAAVVSASQLREEYFQTPEVRERIFREELERRGLSSAFAAMMEPHSEATSAFCVLKNSISQQQQQQQQDAKHFVRIPVSTTTQGLVRNFDRTKWVDKIIEISSDCLSETEKASAFFAHIAKAYPEAVDLAAQQQQQQRNNSNNHNNKHKKAPSAWKEPMDAHKTLAMIQEAKMTLLELDTLNLYLQDHFGVPMAASAEEVAALQANHNTQSWS